LNVLAMRLFTASGVSCPTDAIITRVSPSRSAWGLKKGQSGGERGDKMKSERRPLFLFAFRAKNTVSLSFVSFAALPLLILDRVRRVLIKA
jgi:hypothetical protein